MNTAANAKLITCILPKGRSLTLQARLLETHQIVAGNFHYGRGVGRDSHIRDRGIGEQQEREVFELVVAADLADELFEYIFFEANMDEPHGGMIFITDIRMNTAFSLPELAWEED